MPGRIARPYPAKATPAAAGAPVRKASYLPDVRYPRRATGTVLLSPEAMGHFDENGVYVPRSITEDDLGGGSLEDAMAGTIVEFEDGDLVEGPW